MSFWDELRMYKHYFNIYLNEIAMHYLTGNRLTIAFSVALVSILNTPKIYSNNMTIQAGSFRLVLAHNGVDGVDLSGMLNALPGLHGGCRQVNENCALWIALELTQKGSLPYG